MGLFKTVPIALAIGLGTSLAYADVVSDWNAVTTKLVHEVKMPPPPANRAVAMVQTSVFAAVNAITGEYSSAFDIAAREGASVEAATASATLEAITRLLPDHVSKVKEIYEVELAKLPDDDSRAAGIEAGVSAVNAIFEMRSADKPSLAKDYRPVTTPGVYVPTIVPAAYGWAESRDPWALEPISQFRPGPPPELSSERWSEDYNEILEIGAADSTVRTDEQTAAALFWQATSPQVYFPIVRSVTEQPGREVTRNARLLAATAQSTDDALAAVFDAKHAYKFWRPLTAIRNADQDGNDATTRRADWNPLINTPMHPEYPCAHCIVSSAVGTSLKLDLGSDPVPTLTSASPSDPDNVRSWGSIDAFVEEVTNARVWEGVHYRYSGEVAQEMGQKIAEAVAASL